MRVAALLGAVVGCGLIWLFLGRQIVLVFDLCFPGPRTPKPTGYMQADVESLVLGSRRWPMPAPVTLMLDAEQKLRLSCEGREFTFGQVKKYWDNSGKPQYEFISEPGDIVSFTRDTSRLECQTPFAIGFLGRLPKRHRYAYDRLRWTKNSGATLEITWRDQQNFYPGSTGWSDANNERVTGITVRRPRS
jgi:hypothetical protein